MKSHFIKDFFLCEIAMSHVKTLPLFLNYQTVLNLYCFKNVLKVSTSQEADSVVAQFEKFLREEGQQHVLDAVAY